MNHTIYEDLLKVLGCLTWRRKVSDHFFPNTVKDAVNFSMLLQRRELEFMNEVVMRETLTYCEK